MKKITLILLTAIISIGLFTGVKAAQGQFFFQEAIVDYHADIVVERNNAILVTETITYDTDGAEIRGVFREIYPYSSQKKKMHITDISVTDEAGTPYQFAVSESKNKVRIKIGDPTQTFSGQKTYVITYRASRAVAQLSDIDEIYWNVTGNDWMVPIKHAHTTITLPASTDVLSTACYYGLKGATNSCSPAEINNGTYVFRASRALESNEGLTIAVGFPKGVVTPYTQEELLQSYLETYWPWLITLFLPLLTLIFSLLHWYRKGRDDRALGVIIPQYEVLDHLTPMEVGGIVNERVDAKSISAELIYLATKGYLRIHQIDRSILGMVSSTDYELIQLKDGSDLEHTYDKELLRAIFEPRSSSFEWINNALDTTHATDTGRNDVETDQATQTTEKIHRATSAPMQKVQLSTLRSVFYRYLPTIIDSALKTLVDDGYYKHIGRMKTKGNRWFVLLFISLWAAGFVGTVLGMFFLDERPLPLIIGIFLSIVTYGIVSHFSPAKTEKGVNAKEHLLGLKDYLQIAEKDRLQFHNAPDKKPELFEALLPYAMILGVEEAWAKEFEGIYTTPPSWYSGSSRTAFNSIALGHALSDFNSYTSRSLSSSPQGSRNRGSSGGGSSGGGGGGGGGGSW